MKRSDRQLKILETAERIEREKQAKKPRYVVTFDPAPWGFAKGPNATPQTIYKGDDETIMYSHVSAVEATLIATYETGEIVIEENGRPRSIEYRDGERSDV